MTRLGEGYRPVVRTPPMEPEPPSLESLILSALMELKDAIRPQQVVVPQPMILEPDLTAVVQAVTGLKAQATPNEIAEAIVTRLAPPTVIAESTSTNEILAKVAGALETLEHRLQGISFQAYGGGAVTLNNGAQSVSATNPLPVTGPLTDAQLRASAVPVDIIADADVVVDTNNSTTTALTAGATFTGTAKDISGYNQVNLELYGRPSTIQGDGTNAQASLFFEFSPDATNWDISVPILVRDPGLFIPYPLINVGRYFRVRYLNDGGAAAIAVLGSSAGTATAAVAQTSFRLQTQLLPNATKELARTLDQSVTGSDPVGLTRAVIMGRIPGAVEAYKNVPFSGSSILNTTTTLLGSAGVFTGTFEDVTGYATVSVLIRASHNSATGGVELQFSTDGTTVDRIVTREYLDAPTADFYAVPVQAQFFRVKYTNSNNVQTGTFVLESRYDVAPLPQTIGTLTASLADNNLAVMDRAILAAKNPAGTYGNIERSTNGGLKSFLLSNQNAQVKQFTATTAVAQLDAIPLANRKGVTIKSSATGNIVIYVGFTGSLTSGNGYELGPGDSVDIDVDDTVPIYVVAASSTHGGSFIEVGGS